MLPCSILVIVLFLITFPEMKLYELSYVYIYFYFYLSLVLIMSFIYLFWWWLKEGYTWSKFVLFALLPSNIPTDVYSLMFPHHSPFPAWEHPPRLGQHASNHLSHQQHQKQKQKQKHQKHQARPSYNLTQSQTRETRAHTANPGHGSKQSLSDGRPSWAPSTTCRAHPAPLDWLEMKTHWMECGPNVRRPPLTHSCMRASLPITSFAFLLILFFCHHSSSLRIALTVCLHAVKLFGFKCHCTWYASGQWASHDRRGSRPLFHCCYRLSFPLEPP